MALTLCLEAGCPNLVTRGRCTEHRRRKPRRRQRYDSWDWQRTRTSYRKRYPTAVCCGQPTVDVDHIIPRRILVAAGIHDPDHDRWLQPLCRSHHSQATVTVDMPLLKRLDAGDDPYALAEEAEQRKTDWLNTINK